MAPPTMAMQMMPEPSAVLVPNPSEASEKIVGNMIELHRPIASSAQPETSARLLAETTATRSPTAATTATFAGREHAQEIGEPTKRPTMAPPQ